MVNSEDVAHSKLWMQSFSSPLLLMLSVPPSFQSDSKLSSGSEKRCRPDQGNRGRFPGEMRSEKQCS